MSSLKMKISMGHWWNNTDARIPNYSDKNLSQCHSVHDKSHMTNLGLDLHHDRLMINHLNHGMASEIETSLNT
jgi:hypothetical protein